MDGRHKIKFELQSINLLKFAVYLRVIGGKSSVSSTAWCLSIHLSHKYTTRTNRTTLVGSLKLQVIHSVIAVDAIKAARLQPQSESKYQEKPLITAFFFHEVKNHNFLKEDNVVVRSEIGALAKKYYKEPVACNLVSYGNNIVASTRDEYRAIVKAYIDKCESIT